MRPVFAPSITALARALTVLSPPTKMSTTGTSTSTTASELPGEQVHVKSVAPFRLA